MCLVFPAPTGEATSLSPVCLPKPNPRPSCLASPSPHQPPQQASRPPVDQIPPSSPGSFLPISGTVLWQGEAEHRGPTARRRATRSASSSWCCWGNRQWESPAWCCASSKASSMSTRRAPSEVRAACFCGIIIYAV